MRDATTIGSKALVRIMQAVRTIAAGECTPDLLSDLAGDRDKLGQFACILGGKTALSLWNSNR